MKVILRNPRREVDVDGKRRVKELLVELDILPSTVLVIRGENSDLLSRETVAAMAAAHPGLATVTVPGQGHAPLLIHGPLIQRIAAFIAGAEGDQPDPDAILPHEQGLGLGVWGLGEG